MGFLFKYLRREYDMHGKLLSSIPSTEPLLRENLQILQEMTQNKNFTGSKLFLRAKNQGCEQDSIQSANTKILNKMEGCIQFCRISNKEMRTNLQTFL
jgi:hypothetical protein